MCLEVENAWINVRLTYSNVWILKQSKKKKGTPDVFRCKNAFGKVTLAFLDSLNKHASDSICI